MASFMLSSKLSLSPSTNPMLFSSSRRQFGKAPPTAPRIPCSKIAQSRSTPLKCASTPTSFPPLTPFPELDSHLNQLYHSLTGKVASIYTTFAAPDNPEIDESFHVGAGVCVDPTLVVTSARVVGRVAAIRESSYKAYIGSSGAVINSAGREPVELTPLAVSFATDVAVLRVVGPPCDFCHVAGSPPEKHSIIMSVTIDGEDGCGGSVGNVRAVGETTIPAKAPWPLKDELDWIEHDWLVFYSGPPPPMSVVYNCKEKVAGSITRISGSPWFNLYGEVVGVASWVLRDDPVGFSVGYVSPVSNIMPMIDYARTKGPQDPVVMDRWIDDVVVAAAGDDQQEG